MLYNMGFLPSYGCPSVCVCSYWENTLWFTHLVYYVL